MTLFHAGDSETEAKIIVALEVVDLDWFKRNLVGALTLMCDQNNWDERGTATTDFARDKSVEMLDAMEIDVIIPPETPISAMMMWPVETPPLKWLICDGTDIDRSTYADLFAVIGETFGAGDGSTTFRLPDFPGKSPMGAGEIVANVGSVAGEQFHTLTTDEMPAHIHGTTENAHTHTFEQYNGVPGGSTPRVTMPTGGLSALRQTGGTTTGLTINSAGNSASHNTVHPVLGVHFIIYAGV